MDYTQSVFIKETNLAQNITREKLIRNLALKENIDPQKPVLMHLVSQYLKGMIGGGLPLNNPPSKKLDNEDVFNKKKEDPPAPKSGNFFSKTNEQNNSKPVFFFNKE